MSQPASPLQTYGSVSNASIHPPPFRLLRSLQCKELPVFSFWSEERAGSRRSGTCNPPQVHVPTVRYPHPRRNGNVTQRITDQQAINNGISGLPGNHVNFQQLDYRRPVHPNERNLITLWRYGLSSRIALFSIHVLTCGLSSGTVPARNRNIPSLRSIHLPFLKPHRRVVNESSEGSTT